MVVAVLNFADGTVDIFRIDSSVESVPEYLEGIGYRLGDIQYMENVRNIDLHLDI